MKFLSIPLLVIIFGTPQLASLKAQNAGSTDNSPWKLSVTDTAVSILHSKDHGKTWLNVTPESLVKSVKHYESDQLHEICAANFLNDKDAWVAALMPWPAYGQPGHVFIEHTHDAGKTWIQTPAIKTNECEKIYLSMINGKVGYLVAVGDVSTGHIPSTIYKTTDGAITWNKLESPKTALRLYEPSGIYFRTPTNGWLTGINRQSEGAPLFVTTDGGKSWTLQSISFPKDFSGGYADTYSPEFNASDSKYGILRVRLIRQPHLNQSDERWAVYESKDSGITWHFLK